MAWQPRLTEPQKPTYQNIFLALQRDVAAGILSSEDRLPTHRELAKQLAIAPATVARAYLQAQKAGLIVSGVGRGSFVSPRTDTIDPRRSRPVVSSDSGLDLSSNYITEPKAKAFFNKTISALLGDPAFDEVVRYSPHLGHRSARAAGTDWLEITARVRVEPRRVIVCNGGQHALTVALAVSASAGSKVLVEEYTYPGFKAAAAQRQLDLVPVRMDGLGIDPDALADLAQNSGARAVYLMPTIHNPTTATLPIERRRAVAKIAEKFDLTIIQDGTYDFLKDDNPATFIELAPNRTLYLNSLAKSVTPGLQIGFLVVPDHLADAAAGVMRSISWSASPLSSALASVAISSGTAKHEMEKNRMEAKKRQASAFDVLNSVCHYVADPNSYHGWITLDAFSSAGDFVARARDAGVSIVPVQAFAATSDGSSNSAIRISVIAPASSEVLDQALRKLANLLMGKEKSYLSIV